MKRVVVLLLVMALSIVAASCSDGISASNCDEVVDVTMDLFQRLIDDIDAEFGEMSVQDFIDTGGDLPSVEKFTEDAAAIDEIAADLGCTQAEITAGVEARVGELTASTDLGRFLITAIRSGGL